MPPVLCNMERAHVNKLHVVGKINIEKSKARSWSSRRRSTPETAANWNKKRREGGLNKRILRRAIEEEKLDIYCLMERESTQVTRVAHTFPFFLALPSPIVLMSSPFLLLLPLTWKKESWQSIILILCFAVPCEKSIWQWQKVLVKLEMAQSLD